jgi:hypothetical protein
MTHPLVAVAPVNHYDWAYFADLAVGFRKIILHVLWSKSVSIVE